jgi:PhnB protein
MAKKRTAKTRKTATRRAPAEAKKARTKAKPKAVKKTARAAPKRAAAKSAAPTRAPEVIEAQTVVTPYICVKGGAAALDFYKRAFGAKETMRMTAPDGTLGHASFTVYGAPIMLSDEWPDGGVFAPGPGGSSVTIHLYVPDVDAFFARATAAGALSLRPVEDMPYGDRAGTLKDPFGHRWMISTHREDVSKGEMEKRFGGGFKIT